MNISEHLNIVQVENGFVVEAAYKIIGSAEPGTFGYTTNRRIAVDVADLIDQIRDLFGGDDRTEVKVKEPQAETPPEAKEEAPEPSDLDRDALLSVLEKAGVEVPPRTRTTTIQKMVADLPEQGDGKAEHGTTAAEQPDKKAEAEPDTSAAEPTTPTPEQPDSDQTEFAETCFLCGGTKELDVPHFGKVVCPQCESGAQVKASIESLRALGNRIFTAVGDDAKAMAACGKVPPKLFTNYEGVTAIQDVPEDKVLEAHGLLKNLLFEAINEAKGATDSCLL